MLDLTWKVFSQTGNIETYLLLKELENVNQPQDDDPEAHEVMEQKEDMYHEF